ncbi:BnaA06g10470D [Brassica napus]|uniref:BnaA06g10470D protein n=1 Tax=Brassica napus TaxID=3708 RepID=A0A078HGS3_BRANA|nr:BnaA06g10470D [Brassica napus]
MFKASSWSWSRSLLVATLNPALAANLRKQEKYCGSLFFSLYK